VIQIDNRVEKIDSRVEEIGNRVEESDQIKSHSTSTN